MIKKIGNKGLLLILILLLAVFGISRYISNRKGENTFQTAIIPKIDSARMNGMVIFQKATKKGRPLPFVFTRKGKDWYVSQGDISGRAEPRAANYMLSQLQQISPDRLASNDPNDWKQYNVNDSLGTRVVLLYDKDTALDVIVGSFSYIPQQRKAMSHVRLSGQKEVYTIDGMISLNIANEFNNWRDRKIMPGDYAAWTKLTFTYPADSGFVVAKDSNNEWKMNNGQLTIDSVAAVTTIKTISDQNYGTFIDKFDSNGKQPLYMLRVEGRNFSPVLIKAYPADTANKFAINSTINRASFFSGKNQGMFSKIFPSKKDFYKKKEKGKPFTKK